MCWHKTSHFPQVGRLCYQKIRLLNSCHLIRHEFYFFAVSVAEDSTLRQSIRIFAVKESKLLDSIGIARMEEEIQKRVIELTKQNQDSMAEEFGI
jgi:hypothetical protein